MTKFPHITELEINIHEGYLVFPDGSTHKSEYIRASDVEYVFRQGVRVFGNKEHRYWDDHSPTDCSERLPGTCHRNKDHSALLIGVRPIQKPDSLEQLARDLAATDKFENGSWKMNTEYWVERARKLLGND